MQVQTGKGKSTAVRHLLDGYMCTMHKKEGSRRVGFLVDDFKMEYPFDIHNQHGEVVPGLVTMLGAIAKDQLVILTCSPEAEEYKERKGLVRDILKLNIPLESLSLSIFVILQMHVQPSRDIVTTWLLLQLGVVYSPMVLPNRS